MRQDLPVGENLQDHCMVNVNYLTDQPGLFGIFTPENFALLEAEGRGPLTSNYPEAGGLFTTRSNAAAPDVEFHFAAAPFFDEGLKPPPDNGYAFGPVVIKPTSRGKVGLRTPMADSKPTVLCNFLTTDEDRASMLAGVRIALEIAGQPALEAIAREPLSVPASDSEKDIWEWVRRASQTVYHPTSTCAMGAVVDSELRVYGVEGLRVVDASVMPTITGGNTNAATIMIAEKAADLILGKAPLEAAGSRYSLTTSSTGRRSGRRRRAGDPEPGSGWGDLDARRTEASRSSRPVRLERDVVDGEPFAGRAHAGRVGVVGRTLGDVQACNAVGIEPVPGERERRALADREPEHVAVEALVASRSSVSTSTCWSRGEPSAGRRGHCSRVRAYSANGSMELGSTSASLEATSRHFAPVRMRFTGTSSFLPVSVRGIAGTATIVSGACLGEREVRNAPAMRFRSSSSSSSPGAARRTGAARPAPRGGRRDCRAPRRSPRRPSRSRSTRGARRRG